MGWGGLNLLPPVTFNPTPSPTFLFLLCLLRILGLQHVIKGEGGEGGA